MGNKDDWEHHNHLSEFQIWQDLESFCQQKSQQLSISAANNYLIPLSETEIGDVVCIVEVLLGNCIDYLQNIGLTTGVEAQIISINKLGSVIVSFDDKCLGLSTDMADGIFVRRFS